MASAPATPEQRAAWRKLDSERTQGEWWQSENDGSFCVETDTADTDTIEVGPVDMNAEDTVFIAAASVAIPALLDHADACDFEIQSLRDSCAAYASTEDRLAAEIAKLTATIATLRRVMVDEHDFPPGEFNALLAESEGATT